VCAVSSLRVCNGKMSNDRREFTSRHVMSTFSLHFTMVEAASPSPSGSPTREKKLYLLLVTRTCGVACGDEYGAPNRVQQYGATCELLAGSTDDIRCFSFHAQRLQSPRPSISVALILYHEKA